MLSLHIDITHLSFSLTPSRSPQVSLRPQLPCPIRLLWSWITPRVLICSRFDFRIKFVFSFQFNTDFAFLRIRYQIPYCFWVYDCHLHPTIVYYICVIRYVLSMCPYTLYFYNSTYCVLHSCAVSSYIWMICVTVMLSINVWLLCNLLLLYRYIL